MKLVTLDQGSPEGSAWRSAGIGSYGMATLVAYHELLLADAATRGHAIASRAVKIKAFLAPLGMTRHFDETPWRLWAKKKGLWVEPKSNKQLDRWLSYGSLVVARFEEKHSTLVLPACAEHEKYPFLRVAFDGLMPDAAPLKLACLAERSFRAIQQDGLFGYYYPQVQSQLAVSGAREAHFFAALVDEDQGTLVDEIDEMVPRNDKFIAAMLEVARYFWETYVVGDEEPPLVEALDVMNMDDNAEWTQQVDAYQEAQAEAAQLEAKASVVEARMKSAKDKLAALAGTFPRAEGSGIRYNAFYRKGNIDWPTAFAALAVGVDSRKLDAYRKGGARQIRITPVSVK